VLPPFYPTKEAATTVDPRDGRELVFALGIHTFALVVYAVIVFVLLIESKWDPFVTNSAWSTLGFSIAAWLTVTGPIAWMLGLLGLITWWLQRRLELVPHAVKLDSLLWLGPWLVFFLPWERTRRVIIPPPRILA
jgi:hypothetical protein